MPRTPKTPASQSVSFSHIAGLVPAEGDALNAPLLGVRGCSKASLLPAALRHVHDVGTCGGIDQLVLCGGGIKPPREWQR